MLRALTRLRSAGWGIALDDVGGDSRSLALMSVLYPDVIKLDLRLLSGRDAEDVARIVTAVGAEAERRHTTVLAEGIDSEEQLATARAVGATLGQGYLLGDPAALPDPLPEPGRPLRFPGSGGDPFGTTPWERVTNWRRPYTGSGRLAGRAARLLIERAAEHGRTAMILAALTDETPDDALDRYALAARARRVRRRAQRRPHVRRQRRPRRRGPTTRSTGTLVALAPEFAACFVSRRTGDGRVGVRHHVRPRHRGRVRAAADGADGAADG